MNDYQQFCKPSMAAALNSVGLDKSFHKAKDQHIYYQDKQGQEHLVLDMLGGYGAVLFGHNNDELVNVAVSSLKGDIAFHNQFSLRQGAAELARELNPLLQQETSWNETFICAFASTGAESVEVAIKHAEFSRGLKLDNLQEQSLQAIEKAASLSNQPWHISDELKVEFPNLLKCENSDSIDNGLAFIKQWNKTVLNRPPLFIALKNAFHGKLNASIQMTHGEMYRQPFRRMGINSQFFTAQDLSPEMLQGLLNKEKTFVLMPKITKKGVSIEKRPCPLVAAILVEPVQGEGGVYSLSRDDAKALHLASQQLGSPIISDEVQSGCGRCGSFLAGSQIGLKPDYVVLSKALGGGIAKIGVVAIRQSQFCQGFDLLQSSTFGEDDLSSRIALNFIKQLTHNEGQVLSRVVERGNKLKSALTDLQQQYPDVITDIRGKGLLLGIELKDQSQASSLLLRSTAYQRALGYLLAGYLLNKHHIRIAPPASAGNVLRIEPCIKLSDANIQQFIDALSLVCQALRYQDTGYLLQYLLDDEGLNTNTSRVPQDFRPWYAYLSPDKQDIRPNDDKESIDADYKVAFINHLISSEWLTEIDPSLADFNSEQTNCLLDRLSFDRRVAPFPPVRIKSSTGATVDFSLFPINATSEQIGRMLEKGDLESLRDAVDERLAAARDEGYKIAGLGMFTSIITNNGKAVTTSGIKLTTGNALTVAMAAQAIEQALQQREAPVKQAAIIGAAGNIASVYSCLIAEYCDSILLIGSGRQGSIKRVQKTAYSLYQNALQELAQDINKASGLALAIKPFAEQQNWLADEQVNNPKIGESIYHWFEQNKQGNTFINISENVDDIQNADLIVCAANASDAFIDAKVLKQNAVICDIAVPHNISEQALKSRPDITCLRGGIVNTPNGESLDARARAYLNEGEVYACMAETITLGLDQATQHYSYGNISKSQVKHIQKQADKHGLRLAGNKETESM